MHSPPEQKSPRLQPRAPESSTGQPKVKEYPETLVEIKPAPAGWLVEMTRPGARPQPFAIVSQLASAQRIATNLAIHYAPARIGGAA